jgi:Putative Flp pilus-assembly TadE/G-like
MWFFRNFWHDTNGLMVPYIGVLLILVIIPLVVLAVDGARYQSLQTQVQAAADAAALAGAAELNGQPGAMSRATDAINNYVGNYLSGMGTTNPVQFSAPAYYTALPPADQLPSNGTPANTDDEAHFVLVTATPVTVSIILPRGSFSAGARAVAGMKEDPFRCRIRPIYICNPWEGTPTNLSTALSKDPSQQPQLTLVNDGTSIPGHSFGWLVPPDNNMSASNLQNLISTSAPKTCYSTKVSVNTGPQPSSVLTSFNVWVRQQPISVAVINCTANAASMGNGQQNANNIPVAAFAQFSISQPVDITTSPPTLSGKFTGTGPLPPFFQNVRLYR